MKDWQNIPRDEQETIVNLDYKDQKMTVYTTRKSVATRLERRCGTPDRIYRTIDGEICAVEYSRKFDDKSCGKFFSRPLLMGSFTSGNTEEDED